MSETAYAEDFRDRIKQKGFAPSRIHVQTSSIKVGRTPMRVPERAPTPVKAAPSDEPTSNTSKRVTQLQRFQASNELSDTKMKELILKLANEAGDDSERTTLRKIANTWKSLSTKVVEQAVKHNDHIDMRRSARKRDESRMQGRSEFL